MEQHATTGTARRDLFKGAAGLAVGAAAVTMLAGEHVAAAAGVPMLMTLRNVGSFEVLAYSWGISNSGSTQSGGGAGSGRANVQDLSVTKYIDETSPRLVELVATGRFVADAELMVTPKSGPASTYRLRPVLVTSVSLGGSAGESMLTENVSFNFAAFDYAVGSQTFTFEPDLT
jgi:type VI secretion system secreted protein Hcp